MPTADPLVRSRNSKAYYQRKKDAIKAVVGGAKRERHARHRAMIWAYLADHPCVDCGEADPVVLEFDHRDGSDKHSHVSKMVSHASDERLMAEIAKCDVRCANCHRRRTAKQMGWYQNI